MRKLIVFYVLALFAIFYSVSTANASTYNIQTEIDNSKGYVELPPGRIVITEPIIVPNGTTILGNNTTIVNKSNDYAFKIEGSEGYSTVITSNIIPGGGLDNQQPVIEVKNAAGFNIGDKIKIVKDNAWPHKIEFNRIINVDDNKLTLEENLVEYYYSEDKVKVIKYVPSENVTIKNLNIVSEASYKSYGLFANHTEYLVIENVRFEHITRKALLIQNSYFPTVRNSTFVDNGSSGMGDYSLGIVMSMGTRIEKNNLIRSGAIYVKANINASVVGNISDSTGVTGGDGISVISTFSSLFDSNIIIRPNCYGIWMKNSSEQNTISNNQFISGITSGILLSHDAKHNLITNNIFTWNNGNGIFIDFTADDNIIQNNNILKNNSRGILVHGSNNIITHNTSKNNKLEDIRVLPDLGNVTIDNVTSP